MLAIPVLAGTAAYAVSELFGWRASLESKPRNARKFYYVLSGATILGVCLNFVGIDPIPGALFVRGDQWNRRGPVDVLVDAHLRETGDCLASSFFHRIYLRVVGWIATGVMLIASLGFLITAVHQSLAR